MVSHRVLTLTPHSFLTSNEQPQVAAIHFILGIIIVTIAQSFTALMVGRVFIGLGVGFGLAVSSYN